MKNLKKILIAFMLFIGITVSAQKTSKFSVVTKGVATSILFDKDDAKVVEIASEILSQDILKVSNSKVLLNSGSSKNVIIAGTIGESKWIDDLISNNKIDVSKVKDKWETYSIQVVNNPTKEIDKALVVVGSDRRATAFGLLEISRMIGVSPWEWWADVTPAKQKEIVLKVETKIYGSPSVKYRGIFLNDEDWGLQRWAALNFEPETGDIGPKTYAKVFELVLRLRANTLWPAMHSCTAPFYSYPKNKQVADDYAIVVGTSHCEPMLCNINSEWESKKMGEWRYDNNETSIKELFKDRTKETNGFESMYTMGMRGEHDSPMIVGEDDSDSQMKLLEKVVSDQRNILDLNSGKNKEDVPQIFIPYKEVLTYYQGGMELPEDISLVWTDDNYGYIRQLSTPEEQLRSGGAGIYYHTSYWGRPHDYLWLNSTNPVLMWEEMSKAYEFKSRNLWILNCGDIKPHEYNIELFLDMAWNMENFKESTQVKEHHTNWASREFGNENAEEITALMYNYYQLAFQRRPEFMAWSEVEPVTKSGKTELTQIHYADEVSKRIESYSKLIDKVEDLYTDVAVNRKDAFYQLIYYPVIGASSLNNKWLYKYKNEFVAKQGRKSAISFGQKSLDAFSRIEKETNYYNTKLNKGKWNHIMNMAPRFLPVFSKPVVASTSQNNNLSLGLALEGYEMEMNEEIINSYADVLPVFNAYTKSTYFIDVFLKGEGTLNWEAKPKADWIKISKTKGTLNNGKLEERLFVTIDWAKVPVGDNKKEAPLGHDFQLIPPSFKVNSAIEFISNNKVQAIGVSVFNPKLKELENFKGFVEDKGFVSINAEHFSRKKAGKKANWKVLEGVGYSGNVSVALPRTVASEVSISAIKKNSPVLEYDFYTFNFGKANVVVQAVPTHAFYEGKGVRCAVSIDDAEPVIIDFQTFGRDDEWKQNVLKNATQKQAKQIINKAGKHTLKIWMVDPGVMIDQVLIDLGGKKESYAFPKETKM
ncbi:glycosyl hydrolase 115 family protein [Polaribacter sp. 20A6]|uniref:glycosyl hydrolase 115 family protein n=1 Tax=Polaribacter sp. 20A6 TaxID=2687289 RepID=UPI0013FD33D3|nr:glycosyl hydrolase 115 family protein [Polaribacter sp. 20A6]